MVGCLNCLTAMATERQLPWQNLLILILTVLPSCRSLVVTIPEAEYEVASGGDVTLTCNFAPARPQISTLVLRWEADPDNVDDPMVPVATFFLNSPVDISPAYEGRANLEVDTDQRTGKLHLTKVTMKDSRRFQCSVLIPNDDEGTTIASTSLLVLVPPSPPVCRIKGEAEYFHNISLTCASEEGSPTPTYEWKSFTVENISRHFPPKTTEKEGVLSLFNISKETSGFFVCSSTNRISTASCTITLAVMPSSSNAALIAGIIVGVIAGVLVVGIVIFCCMRKKAQKAKSAEGAPGEVQFYDKDAPEGGEQYLDDKPKSATMQHEEYEDKDNDAAPPAKNYPVEPVGRKLDVDEHSQTSGRDRNGGHGSDVDSQRHRDRGSRDRLDEQRDNYRGSRDRLEEQHDNYRGSRDRLDDQRDQYRGSRDRLDDQRDQYRGSRDRLDDQRDQYHGSRNRHDDQRDHSRGSRDRLDDQRDQYRGSRDRLDYRDDQYRD